MMDSQKATLVALVMLAVLPGCAAIEKWPLFDETRASAVVVAGHFSGVRELDEVPCMLSPEEIDLGTIDCWSGVPGVATLHVYQVLHGTVSGRRLKVAYHPYFRDGDRPPERGKPLLAVLISDGQHYALSHLRHRIARTARGEWALPVEDDSDLKVLPCGALPLVQPVEFAHPRPGQSLRDYDDLAIQSLKENPRVRIRSGSYFVTHGIPLRDIKNFLDSSTPAALDDYYCREYEFPEERR